MIKLIKCTPEDVETLRNISIETFSATFGPYNTEANLKGYLKKAYDIEVLRQELSNQNSEFYFAYEDDEIAGYLKINILDAQSEKMADDFLEVQRIYVREQFKRHGIGKKMLEFAIKRANDLGKDRLWLGVWEKNFAAQNFYHSLGFEKYSSHRFTMGDSVQTDFILKKELRK